MPILIIGDTHFKESMSYADFVEGRREEEKKEILDFIVKASIGCSYVVFLGDVFNARSNHPDVIKDVTAFLERFNDKEVFIIKGNHEGFSNGRSALDYLREIKNKKWHIITNDVQKHHLGSISAVFCPYFTKAELGAMDNKEAADLIMSKFEDADILFHHHTMSIDGKIAGLPLDINQLPEPVLPLEKLNKKFKLSFGGHIHKPNTKFSKAIVSGSIFNSEVGETEKYVWKIDETKENWETTTEQIKLPGRPIYKVEDPTKDKLESLNKNSIVKVIFTKQVEQAELDELKKILSKFDAHIIIERISKKRNKMHYTEGESILDFDINKLLKTYADDKGVDYEKLSHGFSLIRL